MHASYQPIAFLAKKYINNNFKTLYMPLLLKKCNERSKKLLQRVCFDYLRSIYPSIYLSKSVRGLAFATASTNIIQFSILKSSCVASQNLVSEKHSTSM